MNEKKKKNPGGILDWIVDFFVKPLSQPFALFIGLIEKVAQTAASKESIDQIKNMLSLFQASPLWDLVPQPPEARPKTADEAEKRASEEDAAYTNKIWQVVGIETASMGLVDVAPGMFLNIPGWRALSERATRTFNAYFDSGLYPMLQRKYRAEYRPAIPKPEDLPAMLWRQKISEDRAREILAEHGFSDEFVTAYMELVKQIPGYQDLIKLMVREIITPEDFITWIGRLGYSVTWASALYDAHFRLPSPEHIYDAFHRGLISEAELDKYIFWHDYQPTTRPDISKTDLEIMRGLTKTLIPRVDLRRAWRQGEISDAELEQRYGWLGYEDDAPLMARIQKAIALTSERGAVARQFLAGLRKGVKSEAETRKRLTDLRFPKEAIDLLIEVEYVRRAIGAVEPDEEPRILSTAQITRAYKGRLITRSAAMEMLVAQGWDPGAADMLLLLSEPVPEKEEQLTAVKTAAARLYREGYMTPAEFEGHLRGANYSDEDIARIRLAEDLRYRWDFIQDLQRADIEAYRKDILTLEELEASLLARGLQPERAAALIAKEAYKKLPKPRPAPA